MRYDFLYRYYNKYGNDGFKRLMREGFNCRNHQFNYAPTVTAAGHAAIYTGSIPAIIGIVGNDWYDRNLGRNMYCVEDNAAYWLDTQTGQWITSSYYMNQLPEWVKQYNQRQMPSQLVISE